MRTFILLFAIIICNTSIAQTTIEAYSFQQPLIETSQKFTIAGNKLYLAAKDAIHGKEIWSFDNSQLKRETDVPVGFLDGVFTYADYSYTFGTVGNKMYHLGMYKNQNNNSKVGFYEYDITNKTSTLVDGQVTEIGSYLEHNNTLYFTGKRNLQKGLYKYDPVAKTVSLLLATNMIGFSNSYAGAIPLIIKGDLIYIGTSINNINGIYTYNIKTNKEQIKADINAMGLLGVNNIIAVGNDILFTGYSNVQTEIYKYDGTTPPKKISDVLGDGISDIVSPLTEHNGILYFIGEDRARKSYQLASYDTKTNKAKILTSPNTAIITTDIVEYKNKMFYVTRAGVDNAALNYYDIASTQNVKVDITIAGTSNQAMPAFAHATQPPRLMTLGNSLVYTAYDTAKKEHLIAKLTYGNLSVATTTKTINTTLYPNPTSGNSTLSLSLSKSQTLAIQLTDITGRIVYSKAANKYNSGQHNISLPTQQLATGTYIYKLMNENGTILKSGKLVKK